MDIQKAVQNQHLREWAEMVKACRNSGKTVHVWCEENGVNRKTYYHRQKRVFDALPELRSPVQVDAAPNGLSLVELPQPVLPTGDIQVHVGRASVTVPAGADLATVRTVLQALSETC